MKQTFIQLFFLFTELGTPYSTWPQCNQSSVYRTIDGTCNDLQNPWNGAAKTPLTRLTTSRYEDGKSYEVWLITGFGFLPSILTD